MPPHGGLPGDKEVAEMHRILLKVAAHEAPTPEELAFLRAIKIEVLERSQSPGPSMRVDPPSNAPGPPPDEPA